MTDSDDVPVDDSTDVDVAASQLEALNEQLGDDVDISDIDVELEQEYWVDYNHSHRGIVFCWRNNKKQVLLGIEESISPTQETDGYALVLLTSDGGYIGELDEFETEEEALKKALEYQHEYPKGDFPIVDEFEKESDDMGVSRGWMIEDNPLYPDDEAEEDTDMETDSASEESSGSETEQTFVQRLLSKLGL